MKIGYILAVLAAFAFNASVASPGPASGNVRATEARRSCYFESWPIYENASYTVDNIPTHLCNYLMYSDVGVNNDTWQVLINYPETDLDQDGHSGGFRNFTNLKNEVSGLKTTLSLGGWYPEDAGKFSDMVLLKERRDVFISDLIGLLEEYNFDGVDLDWEYPGDDVRGGRPEDKENFIVFLNELRAAMDELNPALEISAVVPINRTLVELGYNVEEVCSIVDAVYCYTYDLRGGWEGFADTPSPLHPNPNVDNETLAEYTVEGGMALWVGLGCPKQKLMVGIPLYGHIFTLADPDQHEIGAPVTSEAPGELSYEEICTALSTEEGWTREWDSYGLVPYAYKGDQWIGYEDPESLVYKMNFIKDNGFAGAMVWAVNQDDFLGHCGAENPMLNVIYDALKNYTVPGTM